MNVAITVLPLKFTLERNVPYGWHTRYSVFALGFLRGFSFILSCSSWSTVSLLFLQFLFMRTWFKMKEKYMNFNFLKHTLIVGTNNMIEPQGSSITSSDQHSSSSNRSTVRKPSEVRWGGQQCFRVQGFYVIKSKTTDVPDAHDLFLSISFSLSLSLCVYFFLTFLIKESIMADLFRLSLSWVLLIWEQQQWAQSELSAVLASMATWEIQVTIVKTKIKCKI